MSTLSRIAAESWRPGKVLHLLLGLLIIWAAAVLLRAGAAPALAFSSLFLTALSLGWAIASLVAPGSNVATRLLLSPAIGLTSQMGLLQVLAWLGISTAHTLLLTSTLALAVSWPLVKHLREGHQLEAAAPAQLGLGVAILALYYLPTRVLAESANGFLIHGEDVSFFHAISAATKGPFPPTMPGLGELPLRQYHFGGYAFPGALSLLTQLPLHHCIADVTRPIGQLALYLALVGLARAFVEERAPTAMARASFLAPLSFFMAGSPTAIISARSGLFLHVPGVPGTAAPFFYVHLGHSVLWGSLVLFGWMGLAFLSSRGNPKLVHGLFRAVLLPLAFFVNVFGAIGAAGSNLVVAGLRARSDKRAWLPVAALAVGSLLALRSVSTGPIRPLLELDPELNINGVVFTLLASLGVRVVFLNLLRDERHRFSATTLVVTALFLGYASIHALLRSTTDVGDDWYGIVYLELFASVFAAITIAMLPPIDLFTQVGRTYFEVLRLVAYGLLGLSLVRLAVSSVWAGFSTSYLKTLLATLGAAALLTLIHRFRERLAPAMKGATMLAIAGSLTAWLAAYSHGELRSVPQIFVPRADLDALRRAGEVTPSDGLIATNLRTVAEQDYRHHDNNSYIVRALSERPVLLEGNLYLERFHPELERYKLLSDRIFNATSESELRQALSTHRVTTIICRPGTDLAIAERPSWLRLLPTKSEFKVYSLLLPPQEGALH